MIAYDNRGTAASKRHDEPIEIRPLADDAAGLLTILGLERGDGSGVSMGGMIAQELVLPSSPRTVPGTRLYALRRPQ
ncbi:MAG: hypothetical protein C4290_02230 [Chloroflexota bacterium]